MGVKGKFTDSTTGLVLDSAYISTYKSNINVSTLGDNDQHNLYSKDPSTKPDGWDESFGCHSCGKFEVHGQVKVYSSKESRDNDMREIKTLNITVFCNETNDIYKCIYDKLKEDHSDLEDC